MSSRASETPPSLSDTSQLLPELPPTARLHAKEPADQVLALVGGQLLSVLLLLVSAATLPTPQSPMQARLLWLASIGCTAVYAVWALWIFKCTTPRAGRAPPRQSTAFRVLIGLSAVLGLVWAALALLALRQAPSASLDALSWILLVSLLLSSHYHAHGALTQPAWLLLGMQSVTLAAGWLWRAPAEAHAQLQAVAVLAVLTLSWAVSRLRAREYAEVQRSIASRLEEKGTLLQQMAHLQEAHSAKSRLLAMVSHDLRQPVHALGLMLGRFREDAASSALRLEIEAVNDVVESLSKSLTMLMAVTRLNSGQVSALPEAVSLERLFRSLAHEFEETAASSHLQLVFEANGLSVTTDPHHLRTILANLISNAIKYTPQGGVQVLASRVHPGAVGIQVRDTGIGIPSHELDRIFDPFVRLHFRKTAADGIGLGLAIVKQTADCIQAPLRVESTVGIGTTFTLELPQSRQAPTEGGAPSDTYLRGLRIVVVDNDETVLESMARTLEEWGCRVIAASHWEELETKLDMTISPIDLILTDFHLDAGFSGYELIVRVRARHQRPIPAILLTGDVEIRHSLESTTTAVVIAYKPLSREKLALLIHNTVSTHAQQQRP